MTNVSKFTSKRRGPNKSAKCLSESQLRDRLAKGRTHAEIAAEVGRHHSSISAACALLGLKRPHKAPTSLTALRARIRELEAQLAGKTQEAA